MFEEFIRKLSNRTGRVISEREADYLLVLTSVEGVNVVICLRESNRGYYAKVILEKNLSFISCREAEYSPLGLYAFSQNIDELFEKVYSKVTYLIERDRISLT